MLHAIHPCEDANRTMAAWDDHDYLVLSDQKSIDFSVPKVNVTDCGDWNYEFNFTTNSTALTSSGSAIRTDFVT